VPTFGVAGWACQTPAAAWSSLTGIPADLSDGDQVGLTKELDPSVNALGKATLACSAGQLAKWNGSAWACAGDADATLSEAQVEGFVSNGIGSITVNGDIKLTGSLNPGVGMKTYSMELSRSGGLVGYPDLVGKTGGLVIAGTADAKGAVTVASDLVAVKRITAQGGLTFADGTTMGTAFTDSLRDKVNAAHAWGDHSKAGYLKSVPDTMASFNVLGSLVVDSDGNNGYDSGNVLKFGGASSGEFIFSTRVAGKTNQYGLELHTASLPRLRIANGGHVEVFQDLSVYGKINGNVTGNVTGNVNGVKMFETRNGCNFSCNDICAVQSYGAKCMYSYLGKTAVSGDEEFWVKGCGDGWEAGCSVNVNIHSDSFKMCGCAGSARW
jgi:hypothetical protein